MAYEDETHRREIFAGIGEIKIIERCEDLIVEVLWIFFYWQEDKGEVWHRNSPDRRDSWLCSQWHLGITKTASFGGNHYFVLFIDDYSRRSWVYTMWHKNKVLDLFVKWKMLMEKHTGRKIKILWSINGEEYKNDPFLQLCQNEGIERLFTVWKTPQQNGGAKRMNYILLEKV